MERASAGMQRWAGRVAVVTGAASGIGAAMARRLATEGMTVVGIDKDEDRMKAVAGQVAGVAGSLVGVRCDVTQDEEVLELFRRLERDYCGADVLVNNAATGHRSSLLDGTPKEWREALDGNVVALSLCTREAVSSMRARGVDDGCIINICSVAAHRVSPLPNLRFYSATKSAVLSLSQGLRQELRQAGSSIRVTTLSPGSTFTPGAVFVFGSEEAAQEAPHMEPEDVAEWLVHVLSTPPYVQIGDVILANVKYPL